MKNKVNVVRTVFAYQSFAKIAGVFDSLPSEDVIQNALDGNMTDFLRYLEANNASPGEFDYNWAPAQVSYSTAQAEYEDGGKITYLKEVEFITPTSGRIITVSEDPDPSKRWGWDQFNITIKFGGSVAAAHEVLSSIKLGSFADEYTTIEWTDGSVSSLLDYELSSYDKLRHRRKSRWTCKKYDDVSNVFSRAVLLSKTPSIDLSANAEIMVNKMRDVRNDVAEYVKSLIENSYSSKLRVQTDEVFYDLVKEVLYAELELDPEFYTVEMFECLEHAVEAVVFATGEEFPTKVLYLKD
ncbi:hypothetical protein PPM_p0254 (plasmid) [Paenibacillus polymyxa M1]|uniref:hypothetical protein n=1 Tax=Paenibacillus polymyxa TaxID=1406 RepID=UPI00021BBA88|nr:hypothetical protein [Paenibacillus polymyxa]CCC86404.1 hypothetical protein PPM_p0254 [Paenibacillus polymyxa M1]